MILKIQSLTMSFGGVNALENISFDIEKGVIHGVIGPNGSGKTTLFNCISGIYKPTSGKIEFEGEDITNLEPHLVAAKGIARTFQLLRVFPSLSVLDNLIISQAMHEKGTFLDALIGSPRTKNDNRIMEEKAWNILNLIGLDKKAHNSAEEISIGQRRMLQLGMGMISDPKLLLLDECAAGLDPVNIDKLIELVYICKNDFGITVLMIEHIMDVVMNVCDKLTVFDYGLKIFEGKPEEAQENQSVIEAYLGPQE